MGENEFLVLKGAAVGIALIAVTIAQVIAPYRGRRQDMIANWKVNMPLAVLNAAITSFVCGGCACLVARFAEGRGFGLGNILAVSLPWRIGASVVILDLTAYLWHRANHRLLFLWRFHAVHHSDQIFEVSTALRFHPGEILISLVIRLSVVALFGIPVFGILVFEMVYAFFNLVEHGNIRVHRAIAQWVELVFITPAIHRKHHSKKREDLDSNYGTIFSFWDRILSTHHPSSSSEAIAVGLPGWNQARLSFMELLRMPLTDRALR